jgi:hypothetical protein
MVPVQPHVQRMLALYFAMHRSPYWITLYPLMENGLVVRTIQCACSARLAYQHTRRTSDTWSQLQLSRTDLCVEQSSMKCHRVGSCSKDDLHPYGGRQLGLSRRTIRSVALALRCSSLGHALSISTNNIDADMWFECLKAPSWHAPVGVSCLWHSFGLSGRFIHRCAQSRQAAMLVAP